MAELWGTMPVISPVINLETDDEEEVTIVTSVKRARSIQDEFEKYVKELENLEEISFLEILDILNENGIYLPHSIHLWELEEGE